MRLRVGSPSPVAERLLPVVALLVLASLWTGPLPAQGTTVAETYRAAYDTGFGDGSASGRVDRRNRKRSDLADKAEYLRADNGYDPARHEHEVYVLAYRRGFEDGYEKGYGAAPGPDAAEPFPPADRPVVEVVADSPSPSPSPPAPARGGTLAAGTTLRLELLSTLSTRFNEPGDPFRAVVMENVVQEGATWIPAGAQVLGSISRLKRAGRIRGRAEMNLRFEEIRLPDGRTAALEAIVVDVESPGRETVRDGEGAIVAAAGRGDDAKKVGTAAGMGGLIGVIAGGKRGAGAGAAAGAVAGLANVLVSRGRDASLESRTRLDIRLTQPLELPQPRP